MLGVVVEMLDGVFENRFQFGAVSRYGVDTAQTGVLGRHHGAVTLTKQTRRQH